MFDCYYILHFVQEDKDSECFAIAIVQEDTLLCHSDPAVLRGKNLIYILSDGVGMLRYRLGRQFPFLALYPSLTAFFNFSEAEQKGFNVFFQGFFAYSELNCDRFYSERAIRS